MTELTEVRNILLIGRTGGGKSTLGNVLINNNDFEEVFKESDGSVSATKNIDEKLVEIDVSRDGSEKVEYRIIDTIGIGDTKLTAQGVLTRLAEIANRVKSEGLNHILFVTKGRFTKEEVEAYDLLSSIIFDSEVLRYTTIVRTNFNGFEDREKCDNDRAALRMENGGFLDAVDIVYVNNPSIEVFGDMAKKIRESSRKRLLTYLAGCQGNYRPSNIDELEQRIQDYKTNEEKLEDKMKELEADRKRQEEEFRNKLTDMKEEYTKVLRENKRQFENLHKTVDKISKAMTKPSLNQSETTSCELTMSQREQIQKAFEDTGLSLVFKTGVVDVIEKEFFSTTLDKKYATFMYHSKATVGLGYAFALIEYKLSPGKVEIVTNTRYPDTNPVNVYMFKSKAYKEMAKVIDDVKRRDAEVTRRVQEDVIKQIQVSSKGQD
ncbi:unnamed protein product [Rhizophagus irregularis]|uniref:AIG1-type G domain-containing protein n=1 Tax=Rhizophagus irregularis TaxID=588596 RepID=A0A2I1HED2_9GLOM|nr:hypothetical protein RhiirA4_509286 [Rhizophagus irregularis]CAB4434764.1 unnamed protein product [Rhizophagus irregularis]